MIFLNGDLFSSLNFLFALSLFLHLSINDYKAKFLPSVQCLYLTRKKVCVEAGGGGARPDTEIKSFKHQNWILRVQSQKHGSVKEQNDVKLSSPFSSWWDRKSPGGMRQSIEVRTIEKDNAVCVSENAPHFLLSGLISRRKERLADRPGAGATSPPCKVPPFSNTISTMWTHSTLKFTNYVFFYFYFIFSCAARHGRSKVSDPYSWS